MKPFLLTLKPQVFREQILTLVTYILKLNIALANIASPPTALLSFPSLTDEKLNLYLFATSALCVPILTTVDLWFESSRIFTMWMAESLYLCTSLHYWPASRPGCSCSPAIRVVLLRAALQLAIPIIKANNMHHNKVITLQLLWSTDIWIIVLVH